MRRRSRLISALGILLLVQQSLSARAWTYSLADWMENLRDNALLAELTMPASHDAGVTEKCREGAGWGAQDLGLSVAQGLSLAEQMNAGVRFFDLRPCIHNGDLRCCHFASHDKVLFKQVGGAYGETFWSAFESARNFLRAHPRETLIFEVSHWDHAVNDSNDNDEHTRQMFFNEFLGIYGPILLKWDASRDGALPSLNALPLKEARGKVVVVCGGADAYMSEATVGRGAWKLLGSSSTAAAGTFCIYDKYANEDDYGSMSWNQICKWQDENAVSNLNRAFLLSWTLTLKNAPQEIVDAITSGLAIKDFAEEANPHLLGELTAKIDGSGWKRPTFVLLDYMDGAYASGIVAFNSSLETKGDLADAEIALSSDTAVWDGTAKRPDVRVTLGAKQLMRVRDYSVAYESNVGPGVATVVVSGLAGYNGERRIPFAIIPRHETFESRELSVVAGTTLEDGVAYEVNRSTQIAAAGVGQCALRVAEDAVAVLRIAKGATLTLTGGPGSGAAGGGAGLCVPRTSTLVVLGEGELVASGGAGASGSNGGRGGDASRSNSGDGWGQGGNGASGGAGGGGAGAGIGGCGGCGGDGGAGVAGERRPCFPGEGKFDNGTPRIGGNGGDGGAGAEMGCVLVLGSVLVRATAGAAGGAGGAAGGVGSDANDKGSGFDNDYASGGGGGGAGGASGAAAPQGIGGGGGGGGGGGAGGAGGTWSTDDGYYYLYGQGGRGGIGRGGARSGASASQAHGYRNKNHGGFGGNGGEAGADGAAGMLRAMSPGSVDGGGALAPWDGRCDALSWRVALDPAGGTGGVSQVVANLGLPLPAPAAVPVRPLHVFAGYADGDGVVYYDGSGRPARSYETLGPKKLTAKWSELLSAEVTAMAVGDREVRLLAELTFSDEVEPESVEAWALQNLKVRSSDDPGSLDAAEAARPTSVGLSAADGVKATVGLTVAKPFSVCGFYRVCAD